MAIVAKFRESFKTLYLRDNESAAACGAVGSVACVSAHVPARSQKEASSGVRKGGKVILRLFCREEWCQRGGTNPPTQTCPYSALGGAWPQGVTAFPWGPAWWQLGWFLFSLPACKHLP